jgi:hypothetical protein
VVNRRASQLCSLVLLLRCSLLAARVASQLYDRQFSLRLNPPFDQPASRPATQVLSRPRGLQCSLLAIRPLNLAINRVAFPVRNLRLGHRCSLPPVPVGNPPVDRRCNPRFSLQLNRVFSLPISLVCSLLPCHLLNLQLPQLRNLRLYRQCSLPFLRQLSRAASRR